MDSTLVSGLPLNRAPVDDLDGCPLGWDPLDGVPVDDIDGVPLGVAIDDIDGMPCESTTYQQHVFHSDLSENGACKCRIFLQGFIKSSTSLNSKHKWCDSKHLLDACSDSAVSFFL